jgi:Rrf2 family transcriptional regulator, cysteine metabolism repressor
VQISNKCYYALRALFELARRHRDQRPIKIANIASAQSIPKRFLEVILNELRQGGFVESRRGVDGGYLLAREPEAISVGEVVCFVDGNLAPVDCAGTAGEENSRDLNNVSPYFDFWSMVSRRMDEIYNGTSLSNIIEDWERRNADQNLSYDI